jgi:hypothetical protein
MQAFVVFGSAEEAARACERDKEFFAQRFGQRYVRVVPAGELTPEDARRASALMGASIRGAPRVTKATVPAPAPAADVVKLRGLPVRAAASDVAAFFAGYKIKAGGVHLQPFSENRHSKVAFVEFASPEEAERALVSTDGIVAQPAVLHIYPPGPHGSLTSPPRSRSAGEGPPALR